MTENDAGLVYFWLAVLLWDHAATYDTAMKPAPNLPWFVLRCIAIMYYVRTFSIVTHALAEWLKT